MTIIRQAHVPIIPAGGSGGTSANIDTRSCNFLLLAVSLGTLKTAAVSDSKGNTWTALTNNDPGVFNCLRNYYCVNPIVDIAHNFTVGGGAFNQSGSVVGYSGVSNSPINQQANGNSVFANTTQPGPITPTLNGSLLICSFGDAKVGVYTVDSGFSIADAQQFSPGNFYGCAIADLIQVHTAGVNPTWTIPAGGNPGLIANMVSINSANPPVFSNPFPQLLG